MKEIHPEVSRAESSVQSSMAYLRLDLMTLMNFVDDIQNVPDALLCSTRVKAQSSTIEF